MYKIPLCCKNSAASDLCFSPRTKIVCGPEAFHTVTSRRSGWVLLLEEPQGAPSLGGSPTSAPTGRHPPPQVTTPLSPIPPIRAGPHLLCPTCLLPGPFSPRPEEKDTERKTPGLSSNQDFGFLPVSEWLPR